MNENERVMETEFNPYDHLIEPESEPVRSPVILGNASEPENKIKSEKTMEIVPLAGAADYTRLQVRVCETVDVIHMEVEEDLLVPDTFPDMESILNMAASVESADTYKENGCIEIRGKLKIETMYRSAEQYGCNISVVPASVEFCRDLNSEDEIQLNVEVAKTEYRIINERKYRVKISLAVRVKRSREKEKLFFEGIEGEKLYFKKDTVKMMDLISHKKTECDINEELFLNDDKIRPVKILKAAVTTAVNHCQMTKEKLILNQTIWVRILYLAEIASKGNLSNQPMLFHGKIDNTQFIAPDRREGEAAACTTSTPSENLNVEINREGSGFTVSGEIKTEADFYGEIKKEIVTDFYHEKEEMTCDCKPEKICMSVSGVSAEQTLRESISLQDFSGDELRIIYLDACVTDPDVSVENGVAVIRGKLHMEAVVMNEGDYTMMAKKICDFTCTRDLPQGDGSWAEPERIFVREMTGDITGGKINLTAQLQADMNIYNETEINCISNPCIVRSGQPEKQYPVTVHTVTEGESIWDIGKKYKVGEEAITAYNKAEDVKPGRKIIIVK